MDADERLLRLEERMQKFHSELTDREWSHHHDHGAQIGDLSGSKKGMESRMDSLERRIDSLQETILRIMRDLGRCEGALDRLREPGRSVPGDQEEKS